MVTARFLVGTDEDTATTRVHEKIRANIGDLPKGIPEPLIVGRGINDVAIVTLTLSASPGQASRWSDNGLFQVAEELQHELAKVDNVGAAYIVGGAPEPDPRRARPGKALACSASRSTSSSTRSPTPTARSRSGPSATAARRCRCWPARPCRASRTSAFCCSRPATGGRSTSRTWRTSSSAPPSPSVAPGRSTRAANGELERRPAVTLAVAKRKGANAVTVADDVLKRLEIVRGRVVPAGLEIAVTRNYGATATEKANELLFHLALATVSIVALITVAIGWREGLVVLIVIPTTILLTLFASWLMGYTINRVSLFALIFSIGILVDDAIVMVENIARHWGMLGKRSPAEAAIEAVAEVGNPTIVATLTIVAALLPMMFVSGMMGPYMSPIPANASIAMLFSFFVAVTVTPWLLLRFAGRKAAALGEAGITGSARWAASTSASPSRC